MKKWLTDNWHWAILNLVALVMMASLLWPPNLAEEPNELYSPLLVNSGKWAIRFLLFSLLMTPLNTLFGWRWAVKLRKPAGLWAFEFVLIHFVANLAFYAEDWLRYPIPDYLAGLGVIGLCVLTAMALTSSRWAMKLLGKWWKRLHRLVYAAGLIVIAHALLEASNKRVALYDAQVEPEVWLYGALLILLLAARVSQIRSALAKLKQQRSSRLLNPKGLGDP